MSKFQFTTADLPEAVREAGYELSEPINGGHTQTFPGFGTINLSAISVEQAERLVAAKFRWLKHTPPSAPKTNTAKKD